MTLQEVLLAIVSSSPEEWNTITCWGAYSGPSYRYKLSFYEKYEGQDNVLHADEHANVAALISDPSITMAWGLECNHDFKEEWANKFPDSHASSSYVDVFYNGSLVFRTVGVSVDGGRAFLPIPSIKRDEKGNRVSLDVPENQHNFFRLLDSIGTRVSEFDRYFGEAGFRMVKGAWKGALGI